jgi:L-alanine-DL-glutamate epimerase-like enolase superfamily enzyme
MLAGLAEPRRVATTYTIGAAAAGEMARVARSYTPAPRLKMKLTGEDDAARVRAVRDARPDAWLGVDANQGYTRASLEALLPALVDCGVALIEQPVAIGADTQLADLHSPIPIAADESSQDLASVAPMQGIYDVVSIKLDKCGGLTEGLLMVEEIRRRGMRPMVGCMEGTSLAVGPAFLVAQRCDFVDVDAPLFLSRDREPQVEYRDGYIMPPTTGWGLPEAAGEKKRAMQ